MEIRAESAFTKKKLNTKKYLNIGYPAMSNTRTGRTAQPRLCAQPKRDDAASTSPLIASTLTTENDFPR